MRGAVTQAALVHISGLNDEMRRHREIAEQPLPLTDTGMFRRDHIAKSPCRNGTETFRWRKQAPVFQSFAHDGVGNVVAAKAKRSIFTSNQSLGSALGNCRDHLELLQIIFGDNKVGGLMFGPRIVRSRGRCARPPPLGNSNKV
jgi:hypothetical protein